MFTGIIEATAPVLERTDTALTIARPATFDDLKKGGSISVSGACLTVISFDDASITFNVVPETWLKTTLELLHPGDVVNLERALRADGRLDGHIVQGHVEGTAEVISVDSGDDGYRLWLRLPIDLSTLAVPKGSIAIDGVSLTIASRERNTVAVALIPETLSQTTLGALKQGTLVNIETDILGRYAHSILRRSRL